MVGVTDERARRFRGARPDSVDGLADRTRPDAATRPCKPTESSHELRGREAEAQAQARAMPPGSGRRSRRRRHSSSGFVSKLVVNHVNPPCLLPPSAQPGMRARTRSKARELGLHVSVDGVELVGALRGREGMGAGASGRWSGEALEPDGREGPTGDVVGHLIPLRGGRACRNSASVGARGTGFAAVKQRRRSAAQGGEGGGERTGPSRQTPTAWG